MTIEKTTTTKKATTAKKVTPKATPKVEAEAKQVVQIETDALAQAVAQAVMATKEEANAKPKGLNDDTKVLVMNNTTGRYGYIGTSGFVFGLDAYGDSDYITYGELRRMLMGRSKRHIQEAFIIILDEEVVKELGLTKLYENVVDEEGMARLLSSPEALAKALPNMPKIMKETTITRAKFGFKNGEIYDNRIARVIKDVTGIEVN